MFYVTRVDTSEELVFSKDVTRTVPPEISHVLSDVTRHLGLAYVRVDDGVNVG